MIRARVTTTLDNLGPAELRGPERAGSLGDDVWACGPGPDAFHLRPA